MHERLIHLHRDAPTKPAEGEPCNGCGVCCALETCPIGRLRFLQIAGPCPALNWQHAPSRYTCGLLDHPRQFFPWLPAGLEEFARRRLLRWIASGIGCDCNAEASPDH